MEMLFFSLKGIYVSVSVHVCERLASKYRSFFANSHNQLASPIRLKLHLALNEDLARHERGSVGNCEILMMFV